MLERRLLKPKRKTRVKKRVLPRQRMRLQRLRLRRVAKAELLRKAVPAGLLDAEAEVQPLDVEALTRRR
jgi:hypothetical protein